MPSDSIRRLIIFGLISPACLYDGFETYDTIDGKVLVDFLDEFSQKITKPSVVVLDNASIHRKGEVARMADECMEIGLLLFFQPPYSLHLNIAEMWKILKGKWLKPHHYCSRDVLHEITREILAGVGSEYVINFFRAHSA